MSSLSLPLAISVSLSLSLPLSLRPLSMRVCACVFSHTHAPESGVTHLLASEDAAVILSSGQFPDQGSLEKAMREVLKDVLVQALSVEVPGGPVGRGHNHAPLLQQSFQHTCRLRLSVLS